MKVQIALLALLLPSAVSAQTPARAAVIVAATDIIHKAHYCTFITMGDDGQPQARMVDPIAPDVNFTICNQPPAGVEAAAQAFIVAFNNLDMPAFLDCFADDATLFHPPAAAPRTFPTRLRGKREIERTFQVVFDLIRAGSGKPGPPYQDLQPRDLLIQQFDDSAVLTFHLGTAARTSRRTFVFRRMGSQWKIVHLHASSFEILQ